MLLVFSVPACRVLCLGIVFVLSLEIVFDRVAFVFGVLVRVSCLGSCFLFWVSCLVFRGPSILMRRVFELTS